MRSIINTVFFLVKFWQVLDAERDDANLDKLMEALDEMGKTKQEDDGLLKSLRERYLLIVFIKKRLLNTILIQSLCLNPHFDVRNRLGDPLEDARARAAGPEQLTDDDIQKMMAEVCGRTEQIEALD